MLENIARGLSTDRVCETGVMTKKNEKTIRNILERLNDFASQTNSFIPFLKAAVIKISELNKFNSNFEIELERYSEPSQISKKEFSAKLVNGSKLLTISTKCSILVVRLGYVCSNNFQAFLFLLEDRYDRYFVYNPRTTFTRYSVVIIG